MRDIPDQDRELAALEHQLARRVAAFHTFIRVRAAIGLGLMLLGGAALGLAFLAVLFLAFDVRVPGVPESVAALGTIAGIVLPAALGLVAWVLGRSYWRGRHVTLSGEPEVAGGPGPRPGRRPQEDR